MLTSNDILCWLSYWVASVLPLILCLWEALLHLVGSHTAGNGSTEKCGCCPQRLQMMLLQIQPYDIVIRYKPCNEMTLADSMSQQPCSNAERLEFDVKISHVQLSTQKLDELRRETKNDNNLHSLLKVIADGWPDRQQDLHPQLSPLFYGHIAKSYWQMTALY